MSGDAIASYLAIRLRAKRLIYAIDLGGIYIRDRVTGEVRIAEELKYVDKRHGVRKRRVLVYSKMLFEKCPS